MRAIRSKNTRPELAVRRLLHALGYRYRLHISDLPGKPDIVFPGRRKLIFVNGCFWHSHDCRHGRVRPATNSEFWETKRDRTVVRDAQNRIDLVAFGWDYLDIWECQIADREVLAHRLSAFLGSDPISRPAD